MTLNTNFQQTNQKVNFTFWDMDDTCVDSWNKTIKNPHLLLPIMLFQSFGANQFFGILTNRDIKKEAASDYPVEKFQSELASFGITLSQDFIKFCGGDDSFNAKYEVSTKGLDLLSQFFSKLQICEIDEADEQRENHLAQSNALKELRRYFIDSMEPRIFHGKNYYILDFLEKHLNESKSMYHFSGLSCTKDNLIMLLVDDNPDIAEPAKNLGINNFVGITASRGGKDLPKEGDTTDNYYSVDYLHVLAKQLGLAAYAQQINAKDHPMLQMAALLYLWQNGNCKINDFAELLKQINAQECVQLRDMLAYIDKNSNFQTGYKPVDEIYKLFKTNADKNFLASVFDQITDIEINIAKLKLEMSINNPQSNHKPTKSKLFKRSTKDRPSSENSLPLQTKNTHQHSNIWVLEDKKKYLLNCLNDLSKSEDEGIAQDAKEIVVKLKTKVSPNLPLTIVSENTFTPLANHSKIEMMKKSRSDEQKPVNNNKENNKEKEKKKDKSKDREKRKSDSITSGFK